MLENKNYFENYMLKFIKLNNENLQHWNVHIINKNLNYN